MPRIKNILDRPAVYRLWQAPFAAQKMVPVVEWGSIDRCDRVLDVGCGPGTNAQWFENKDYLGIDLNPDYVDDARRRLGDRFMVRDVNGDLSDLGSFDLILLNSLMHHLDDGESRHLLARIPELLTSNGEVHVLDLVLPAERSIARAMARADRGSYARALEEWEALVAERFTIRSTKPFALGLGGVELWRMVHIVGGRL